MKRVLFFFLLFLSELSFVGLPLAALADESPAVERGLDYFRRRLDAGIMPGDGAFKKNVAVTALVGMAFLSSGSTPLEGPDASYVRRCVELILKSVQADGVIASPNASQQGTVYAHGFAVTFLAECLGMSSDDVRLRDVLRKGVERIVQAQGPNGGWRYSFQPGEEDVSVTACFLTALRACRNAGISVPAETVRKGVAYVLRCQNPDGGFRYRLVDGPSAWPRSAAAITALCAAGTYDSPEIRRGIEYLKTASQDSSRSPNDGYYFYAQYYAIQAFRLTQPEMPSESVRLIRELERDQKPDGSWLSSISLDHATAMALITLQAETNFLPIFQK